MINEFQRRQELAEFGRRLYERGLIAAADGNLSVRLDNGNIVATPTAMCKGMIRPEDMVIVDPEGNHVSGEKEVTSEIAMHTAIYRRRPDVRAVVHAHPPTATGFAAAGLALDEPLVAEMVACLGEVPLAPFGMPGTDELAQSIEPFIAGHKAILLANHGAVTYDETLNMAFWNMERLEHVAKITLVTRILGQHRPLNREEVQRLRVEDSANKVLNPA